MRLSRAARARPQRAAAEPSRRNNKPNAASPIVPVTTTRSPALAPARRNILPCGTAPSAAIETVIGPPVRSVSPPKSGQPKASASAPRPRANGASHASPVPSGSASVSRNPSGFAPLAARSERVVRSAFLATVSGGSSGKKCTPATMPSALSTRSQPAGGVIAAASSARPNAPACFASGAK